MQITVHLTCEQHHFAQGMAALRNVSASEYICNLLDSDREAERRHVFMMADALGMRGELCEAGGAANEQ